MKPDTKRDIRNIICMVIISFIALILLHDICSSSILDSTPWNSYEKQAEAWLHGSTHLDKNYEYLELAIYDGEYYVSFPPLPSVILLPFVMVFGENVPDNLIIALVCILTVIIAYKILRKVGTNDIVAAVFSMFYVFGSNMLAISLNAGVWWIAQAFNLLFCTLAVWFFIKDKRMGVYTSLALAVGCRPLSAIYIVGLFVYWLIKDIKNKKAFGKILVNLLIDISPLLVIANAYMAYNYIRFKNVLEFGHNYLPEFTESEHGQFSLYYLLPNLKQLFFEPIRFNEKLNIEFTKFNGFWFYIANPIFLIAAIKAVRDIIKTHKISILRAILLVSIVLHLIATCCHKTLGGWQFGARYTCDMMAFAFMCMIVSAGEKFKAKKEEFPETEDLICKDAEVCDNAVTEEMIENKKPRSILFAGEKLCPLELGTVEIMLVIFGFLFNIFGAVEFWLRLI